MFNQISSDLSTFFNLNGYAFPFHAFSADKANKGRQIVEQLEQQGSGRLPYFLRTKPHLLLPWFWDLVHSPCIIAPVKALLGDDVLCYGSSFIDKRPCDGNFVEWHQDVTYWGLSQNRAVTAWVALTGSTPQSGCMQVLPGSQQTLLPHTDSNNAKNMLGRGEKLVSDIDASQAVDLILQPGEFSLHDGQVIHGSQQNQTTQRRLGFVARYIPASTSLASELKGSATLVAGRNLGNMALEQAPESVMSKQALQRHRAIFRTGMTTIMQGKIKEIKQ